MGQQKRPRDPIKKRPCEGRFVHVMILPAAGGRAPPDPSLAEEVVTMSPYEIMDIILHVLQTVIEVFKLNHRK